MLLVKSLLFLILLLVPFANMAQQLHENEKIKFLALGDSYTIGESVEAHERWPMLLQKALQGKGFDCLAPTIVATTGWRTDELKEAIRHAKLSNDYNLVSLLIGVNNQYQGKSPESYKAEFEELLQIAIQLGANDKENVFVISIPDYGYTPFGKEKQETISKEVDEFNAINQAISKKYGIAYFNITDISRRGLAEPTLVAADGLHPSGKMYAEWVQLFLNKMLKQ